MSYQRHLVKAPHLTGWKLKLLVAVAELPVVGGLIRWIMLGQMGFVAWRRLSLDEAPAPLPLLPVGKLRRGKDSALDKLCAPAAEDAVFATCADYRQAYLDARCTPGDVASALLAAIDASEHHDPPLRMVTQCDRALLREQAEASAQRYQSGASLGPLDGVPVLIKEELDVAGLHSTVGTRFLGHKVAAHDACVVERLRAAGALIVGKANMHEIGIGVTGLNPHHGACRNPYDAARKTGGSSSGSAASVAAGLVPLSVGADGGGSIRTPASLCGVVGLKPTYGRVSERGAAPLCWSVAHVGPIGATVGDVALGYALMAGPDEGDAQSVQQPSPERCRPDAKRAAKLRVGVYDDWFDDAEPEVVAICRQAVQQLIERGASLIQIEIPDLPALHLAHLTTIVSEMCASQAEHLGQRARYGLDVRLNLALGQGLRGDDYVRAQQWRRRACEQLGKTFAQVDLIVTPTNGMPAPLYAAEALPDGESHLVELDALMRFVTLANLTGLPAISLPAGYTQHGLPVGLQLIAAPWRERDLLDAAAAIEASVEARAPRWQAQVLRQACAEPPRENDTPVEESPT